MSSTLPAGWSERPAAKRRVFARRPEQAALRALPAREAWPWVLRQKEREVWPRVPEASREKPEVVERGERSEPGEAVDWAERGERSEPGEAVDWAEWGERSEPGEAMAWAGLLLALWEWEPPSARRY